MDFEPTQRQSPDEQNQAREMSLQRTAPPTQVPGYEPRRFLGSGAYGEVWVAVDQTTGRQVAIKFYTHQTRIDWSLLSREVEKLVFLSADRYVVQLLDVGWDNEPPYYVMEYMERGSLAQYLQLHGTLPVSEAVEIFRDVTTGLLHAHGKGVLHCDLKPANILLDQDYKPRLADFGQSRLSHEQLPALGTLFYMAPEQADLEAVPDSRWDVYALGALLFCMLTGNPPHRSHIDTRDLDSQASLNRRLEGYRERIYALPPVTEHRRVPQIDRALVEIIDRCLAVAPEDRFPNVQSVLSALQQRDQQRERRPLMVLGFVGPLLLLLVMAVFGWLGYQRSLIDSNEMLTARALESNRFAAKFVSEAVARRIDRYFREVEKTAAEEEIRTHLLQLVNDPGFQQLLAELPPPGVAERGDRSTLERLRNYGPRLELERLVTGLIDRPSDLTVASWFIVDHQGVQLAAVYEAEADSQVGVNFAYRTYFHGGPEDLNKRAVSNPPQHIDSTHLSTAFQSTATQHWKVAVSTPLYDGERFLGVLALTVDLGSIVDFVQGSSNLFTVVVDGREGDKSGAILEHPLFKQLLSQGQDIPSVFQDESYHVPLDTFPEQGNPDYRDPLGQHPLGTEYQRRWIAAREAVLLNPGQAADAGRPSGLIVLVQEDYGSIEAPVRQLGQWLMQQGLLAVGAFGGVMVLLWYAVLRLVRDAGSGERRRQTEAAASTESEPADTIELPLPLRRSGSDSS